MIFLIVLKENYNKKFKNSGLTFHILEKKQFNM